MKQKLKKLIEKIQSHIYLYEWLKPIVCRLIGHDTTAHYSLYEMEKIVKNHDKTEIKQIKKRYDPYIVVSCKRCGRRLRTKKLARQLKYDDAIKMSERVLGRSLKK